MSSPISGFTAIPNPQMLAFMPIQSYLMMYFAGAGWQIGKRKISAIPNDEFNKMSAKDLLEGFTADLRSTIPTLERSLQDITPLVNILVKQYGEFAIEIINVLPQVAQTVAGGLVNPKGALVPPLFGPELEKLVSGGGINAQFLAYAKILLKKEADRQALLLAGSQQGRSGGPIQLGPSTISGLSVAEAQAQARQKQLAFEQQQRDLKKISITKQTAITPFKTFAVKRQAGQSQILERSKLIKEISQVHNLIRIHITTKLASSSGYQKQLQNFYDQIARFQQRLVNLLARYKF